jgi:Tol biopolymer transport system component
VHHVVSSAMRLYGFASAYLRHQLARAAGMPAKFALGLMISQRSFAHGSLSPGLGQTSLMPNQGDVRHSSQQARWRQEARAPSEFRSMDERRARTRDARRAQCPRGRRRIGWLLLTASMLAVFALVPSAQASFPGSNGKIAFSFGGDIEAIDANGTGLVQLTSGGPIDGDPAWAPDGTRIAFTRAEGSTSQIYVMNADGTGLTRLTNDTARDVEPAWSPDGARIAFASNRNEVDPTQCASAFITVPACNFEIYVMNADGTQQTRLTSARFADVEPSWSPNGTKIAFQSYRDDTNLPSCTECNSEIYVMNVDGTAQTRLTFSAPGAARGVADTEPNWSPNAAKIAFSSNRDCDPADFHCFTDIFLMNPDGSAQTRLTGPDDVFDQDPAWSPDGTMLAINRITCGPTPSSGCVPFISIMNADGSQVVSSLCCVPASQPDWQPLEGPPRNMPPDCSGVSAAPSTLWPPNNRLVPVSLMGATDPDGDPITITIDAVTQDEPVGNDADAKANSLSGQMALRAQREGMGDGRVYRIAFTASDNRGGECLGSATVSVPHDRATAAIDSAPPSYDSFGL